MAIRRPPTTFSDEISAADLAANSVTASELADNAVDTAAIADDAVTNAKVGASAIGATELASNAVTTAKITDANITSAKVASSAITKEKIAAEAIEVKPHIKPGFLYPSIKDGTGVARQVDGVTAVVASTTGPAGSTVTSSLYGTVQSDGRMYYQTNIKASKPIKDPRIGAYFGSQRHKFKSLQVLDDSYTNAQKIMSVDGREWIRISDGGAVQNDTAGNKITFSTGFMEITGYFNNVNLLMMAHNVERGFIAKLDDVNLNSGNEITTFQPTVSSTDYQRAQSFLSDSGSLGNVAMSTSLGIHTLTITPHQASDNMQMYGCELIAQDKFTDATCDYNNDPTITMDSTTRLVAGMTVTGTGIPAGATVSSVTNSTTFELSLSTTGGAVTNGTLTFGTNSIDIPAQNVVSYGKKFAVSKAAHHYDPFNGMAAGSNASTLATFIDTATSLGMENWKGGTANYYRPFNGGRVVKWIANDGTIKTSVTMMPPNGQNCKLAASPNTISNAHIQAGTNDDIINMDTSAVTYDLSEVAKSYFGCEYGEGSGNNASSSQVTGGSRLADFSTLKNTDGTDVDELDYHFDDGLTGVTGYDTHTTGSLFDNYTSNGNAKGFHFSFIGTGLTLRCTAPGANITTIFNDVPYGTHVYKHYRDGGATPDGTLDGVAVFGDIAGNTYSAWKEVIIHQPKMPPIPEEAVVIADYMLMADHVLQATDSFDCMNISKGVRRVDCTRDIFFDHNTGSSFDLQHHQSAIGSTRLSFGGSNAASKAELPAFCTNQVHYGYDVQDRYMTYSINGTDQDGTGGTSVPGRLGNDTSASFYNNTANVQELGLNIHKVSGTAAASSGYTEAIDVVSPIHTSHHYKTFETPFLNELIGGDRNMEQTHLVCSPDGKTWDEITRDTSYIGNIMVLFRGDPSASNDTDNTKDTLSYFEDVRGTHNKLVCHQKDWGRHWDRMICLKSGQYRIRYDTSDANSGDSQILINGTQAMTTLTSATRSHAAAVLMHDFQRGDYVQIEGPVQNGYYMQFVIEKI